MDERWTMRRTELTDHLAQLARTSATQFPHLSARVSADASTDSHVLSLSYKVSMNLLLANTVVFSTMDIIDLSVREAAARLRVRAAEDFALGHWL